MPARPDVVDVGPPSDQQISRRRVLALTSAGAAGTVVLTACGGGGGSESPGAQPSSAPPASDAPSPSAGGAAAGATLAKLADVPVGSAIAIEVDGEPVLVAQPAAGTVVAYSAVCPHQGCSVGAGTQLRCPCHGSVFDLASGDPLNGPATAPLSPIAVTVDGDNVVTA